MSDISLFRESSGLVFLSTLDSLPNELTVSPLGRYSITERPGYLRLKHDPIQDVIALLDIPNLEEVCLEIVSDFTPQSVEDRGGIVVWKNSQDKIEFLEVRNDDTLDEPISWMCRRLGSKYDFYSSNGDNYSYVDSDQIEGAVKFGAVLKKGSNDVSDMDIGMIVVTKGMSVRCRNVFEGQYIKITSLDGDEVLISPVSTGSYAEIKLPALTFEGKLEVFDSNGNLISDVSSVFHGGDIFSVGTALQIRKDGVELSRLNQTDLGNMSNGELTIDLEVYNPSNVTVSNVKISVVQYLDAFGWSWCDLSLDGTSWGDLITFTSINASSAKGFKLKVVKGSDYMGFADLQFSVNLTHE